MFEIKIQTSGAAFSEDDGYFYEIPRILKMIATLVADGVEHGVVMDINGNKCGEWSLII